MIGNQIQNYKIEQMLGEGGMGTVWLAVARRGLPASAECLQLDGDRAAVREHTVHRALDRLLQLARKG